MTASRTFVTKVRCEKKWPHPNALVYIRDWSMSSQDTGSSKGVDEDYEEDHEIEAISFTGSFWPDTEGQIEGLSPRPLINLENAKEPQLFNVDMTHPDSIEIKGSYLSLEEKKFRLIEQEVTRTFS